MMKSTSHLPDVIKHSSLSWRESGVCQGVGFAVRRISLAQRIELTKRVRELTLRNEFLCGGSAPDRLDAALGALLARRLYLEWGLAEITGLTIDGIEATPALLIEKGPEDLASEIAAAVSGELQLSEQETKNF